MLGAHHRRWCPLWLVRLFLILLSAELSLQLVAFGYRRWSAHSRASLVTDADLTILCLGDSFTFGVGANALGSYPRQLEQLLKARWTGGDVQVVNAGVPGFTSSQVRQRLAHSLAEARPDLVLLMVGVNDASFAGVDSETLNMLRFSWLFRLRVWLDQRLGRSRLYRLTKLLITQQHAWVQLARDHQGTLAHHASPLPPPQDILARRDEVLRTDVEAVQRLVRNAGQVPASSAQALREQAAAVAQEALSGVPGSIESLLERARLFQQVGRESFALELFQQARALLEREGEEGDRQTLTYVYHQLHQLDQARALLEELIQEDPTNVDHHLALARVSFREGNWDRVEAWVQAALTLQPDSSLGHCLLGQLRMEEGELGKALASVSRAIELDPSEAHHWGMLAEVYRRRGDVELKRQAFRQAFRLHPSVHYLTDLGSSYGDPIEAGQAMRALLEEGKARFQKDSDYWQRHERVIASGLDELRAWLVTINVSQVIDQVSARGIPIALVTYPMEPEDNSVNVVLRHVGTRRPEAFLIDASHALFHRFTHASSGLLSGDGSHPNAKGYALLAAHIVEALESAEIL